MLEDGDALGTIVPEFVQDSSQNLSLFSLSFETNVSESEESILENFVVKMAFLISYMIVFFLCVFGNIMILIVIIGNASMRTVTNFFLANLAIADLLVGIFCAAHFLGIGFRPGTWPFGPTLCHAYIFVLHMIPNSSAGILVLLSIERFIAVLRPMLVGRLLLRSRWILVFCTVLVWTLSMTMNVPYVLAVQYMELKNEDTGEHFGVLIKFFFIDIYTFRYVLGGWMTITRKKTRYIIPLTLLAFIYSSIGVVLWRSGSVADETMRSSTIGGRRSTFSAHTTISRQRSSNYSRMRKHSSAADSAARRAEYRQRLFEEQQRKYSDSGLVLPASYSTNKLLERARELSMTPDERRISAASDRKLPNSDLVDSRKRVIRLCAIIVLVFAIFSMPRYMYFTWSVWRETNAMRSISALSALIQPATFLLMFFNSGLNPVLYAFLSQRFRAAIRDTFNFKRRKEQRKEQLMMALRSHRFSEVTDRHLTNGNSHSLISRSHHSHLVNFNDATIEESVAEAVCLDKVEQ